MRKIFKVLVGVAAVGVSSLFLAVPQVGADTLTFDLGYEFSGAAEPAGDAPWLTATFTDVGDGTVSLTMTSNLSDPDEFVRIWDFNFSGDTTGLSVAYQSGVTGTYQDGSNAFKADGDGYFDVNFEFTANDFGVGDTSVWVFSYSGTLTASMFNAESAPGGGNGTYHTAAHVQGINASPGSGWIGDGGTPPVPEPSTMLLLGSGLLGLGLMRRRKMIRK